MTKMQVQEIVKRNWADYIPEDINNSIETAMLCAVEETAEEIFKDLESSLHTPPEIRKNSKTVYQVINEFDVRRVKEKYILEVKT